jgi:hypothetical protein
MTFALTLPALEAQLLLDAATFAQVQVAVEHSHGQIMPEELAGSRVGRADRRPVVVVARPS